MGNQENFFFKQRKANGKFYASGFNVSKVVRVLVRIKVGEIKTFRELVTFSLTVQISLHKGVSVFHNEERY